MKLWSSFIKELIIASRGFYFYIELAMAAILLFALLFLVPEHFDNKADEYIYAEFPTAAAEKAYTDFFEDTDGVPERTTVPVGSDELPARMFENSEERLYLFDNKDDMIRVAKAEHKIGGMIQMDDDGQMHFTYYLQGNETDRLKSMLRIFYGQDDPAFYAKAEEQTVTYLTDGDIQLTDRENLLPVFLTFNGSLMGFFIIAAYIFLDKKEGVIRAFAVTPSSVWKYLLSKSMVLTITMLATSLMMIIPLMGGRINYLLLIAFLIPTGLFASSLGLVVAAHYDDMAKAFGILFSMMLLMMLPALSYFTPSWDPLWIKFIPSYYIVQGFREIFIQGDTGFTLLIALGYMVIATLLFVWANRKTRQSLAI